ncbi:PAS domain-containing protein [Streptomyces sp. NBC_00154]|uniref:PAS domain-containing protein n=1 Tax=Streptomyces sp. NBC_00154 TaxID=2975670 RepID=UPI002253EB64|nr:PAS domain-containing protein [Streptomyces sp. NBC_00154]MCX5315644.1 PAS domain-containing protein [Streptomyces sp. NBC_00154]
MSVPNVSEGLGARLGDPLQGPYTATAFVDGRGRISLWSMEAEALLGYSADEVCGTLAADLLTAPEGREAALAARERHADGQGWDGVVALKHHDGRAVRIALRVRPVHCREGQAGWSLSASDARQVGQEEVDRAILQALFSQSPIRIIVVDSELRYRWVNAAMERGSAVPAARLIGRRIGEVTPWVNVEGIEEVLRRVRDTGEPVLDFQVRGQGPSDPDREHVWSGSSFRLTDPAGRVLGMCQICVDVTEGYWAQRRLALLTEAGTRIGTTLDVVRTAQELADAAVPELADFVLVDLLEATVRGEEPAPGPVGGQVLLRRSGISSIHEDASEALYAVGEAVAFHLG